MWVSTDSRPEQDGGPKVADEPTTGAASIVMTELYDTTTTSSTITMERTPGAYVSETEQRVATGDDVASGAGGAVPRTQP
jgi:hypothetical protein